MTHEDRYLQVDIFDARIIYAALSRYYEYVNEINNHMIHFQGRQVDIERYHAKVLQMNTLFHNFLKAWEK